MISKKLLFIFATSLLSCLSSPHNSTPEKENSAPLASKNQKIESAKQHPDPTTGIYIQAIEKYLEAVFQRDKTNLETLYVLKRNNGQPDDFPKINLPTSLKNTKIVLLDQKESELQKHLFKKNSPAVNIIGWIEEQKAEFIFVTFFPEFQHSFDYHIRFKKTNTEKRYHFDTLFNKEFIKK